MFLNDIFHSFENRLLPNDDIILRNIREGHEVLGERCMEADKTSKDVQVKREAQSNSSLSVLRPRGLACNKTDVQDIYRLCFGQSTY
jgi:hypothetical protein